MELSVPNDISICEAYIIQGDNEILEQRELFGVGQLGNPKEWALDKKYDYFKRYETGLFNQRNHCGYNTHLLIGLSNNDGLRTCHIGYEEKSQYLLSYTRRKLPHGSEYSNENDNYQLMSYALKLTESDFGQSSIITSTYCSQGKANSKLVKIFVQIPDHPKASDEYFGIKKNRPLQHLIFTNEACDIPTE